MPNEPVNNPECKFRLVREWEVHATGDYVAASLLSFFQSWHKTKLRNREQAMKANAVAEGHGDSPTQDTNLLHSHSIEELMHGILGVGGANKIREGIKILEKLGFLSVFKNPNKRYQFDNTKHFRLNGDVINEWLKNNWPPPSQLGGSELLNRAVHLHGSDGTLLNGVILYGSKEINQETTHSVPLATAVASEGEGSLPLTIPTVGKVLSGSPPKNSANPPPSVNGKKLPTFFQPTMKEASDCFQELCRLKHENGKGCEPITTKEAEDWAEEFIEYYENRDWKISGKFKMKSWELTISGWINRRIKSGWRKSLSGYAASPDNRPLKIWDIEKGIEYRKKQIDKIAQDWQNGGRENPEGFKQAMALRDKLKGEIEDSKQQIISATSLK